MRKLRTMHLFAGAGGGILADILLGHQPVCAVEIDEYCQQVLSARQEDGCFPWFPIFADVQKFDGTRWRGLVDCVSGGFPCQDISVAGNGAGLDGERSGMWHHMARIIGEVQPRYAFIENSPALVSRGLDRVLCDLAAMGFDARWGVVSAADTGAFHKRERIWILANARSGRRSESGSREMEQPGRAEAIGAGDVSDANGMRQLQPQGIERDERGWLGDSRSGQDLPDSDSDSIQRMVSESQPRKHGRPAGLHGGAGIFPSWPADPADAPQSGLGRVVDGMANRSHRIKAIGNGQVSRVAAAAFTLLSGE
jgi:DNA (cytosine-5)-methyltransferase 1